jgi:hypothetical protein
MNAEDDLDIENLRVDPALAQRVEQQAGVSKRKGWQRNYTVVPRVWQLQLLEAKRISSHRLAIELLYLHWYGGSPVTVSDSVAEAAKLSRSSKWRALVELERLALVEVNRGSGKSPRVTLRHALTRR